MIVFDPQPRPESLPARLQSPFRSAPPHELARRAAALLRAQIHRRGFAELDEPGGGKMFGVLVVAAADGKIGYLCGFSGMLGGRWVVEGFVPPLFELASLDEFWPSGQAELAAIELEHRAALEHAGEARAARELAITRHRDARAQLRASQRERRALRHAARSSGADSEPLDRQSRAEGALLRRFEAEQQVELAALEATLAPLDARVRALAERRAARSQQLFEQLHAAYVVENFRGETRDLRSLFAPDIPPGGAGDCAAPKLLGAARRLGLRPLALAEFWIGAATTRGDREEGEFYPACRGKCGPLLPFMLEGLEVEPAPLYGADSAAIADPRVLFEDAWLIVVDKPSGLLSVPGRHERLRDSVEVRLGARFEPFVVHRLDLDTSGLLLIAKDRQTHAALQKQFALRTIAKRYVAWLEGVVAGEEGRVELALRVDHLDRPRQIHDPIAGKHALSSWQVLERSPTRTRVALVPHTGRTHQLRVHAAHPLGLGVAIVGDRLYGRGGQGGVEAEPRLLLHAETLGFDHPHTGARVELCSPVPF